MYEASRLRRILWTFCVAEFLVMQIWYNFSAVLSSLKEVWMLSNFQAGLIVSMFQLGYVVAVLFFSFLSDNHNPQKLFIASMWPIWAIGLLAILYGFLVIGDSPIFSTAVTELVNEDLTGLALGIQSVSGFAVTIVSPVIFGLLLDRTHSWGIAFSALGLGALIGPIALWQLRQLPESYQMARGKQ